MVFLAFLNKYNNPKGTTMNLKKIMLLIFFSLFFFTKVIASSNSVDRPFIILSIDGITVLMQEPEPDIIAPNKPAFTITPNSTTYEDTTYISIRGEVGSTVYVNGRKVGTIDNTGRTIIGLDTSGSEGIKHFNIILMDKAGNKSDALALEITKIANPKYNLEYKGLTFYQQNISPENYTLDRLTDEEFNTLTETEKLKVANKLLSTLFFGYPQDVLLEKINSGHFISDVYNGLNEDRTDKEWLETYIIDDDIFQQSKYNEQEAVDILSRFYAMKDLDKYFLHNWIAYTLTQTIMFSPAYELDTSHPGNIENVYSRIVSMLNVDSSMRYITYVHTMSEDNWRRFRSPEDNGREMLELFHLDENDAHVPIAGQALQNWRLDVESDTLAVGLNQNTQPLHLFGTIILNGDDFYRELVKSSLFTKGVSTRLVNYFFPEEESAKKSQIITSILASTPETWQDIMLQIVFSSEYLLHSSRTKSAEELFFSLSKKMDYKHYRGTFQRFKVQLSSMNQAMMKYKLGKRTQVPLDTFSFSTYHKYIRERLFINRSIPEEIDNYYAYGRQGWDKNFIDDKMFDPNESNIKQTLESLVIYLFNTIISRNPTAQELALFHKHMTLISNNTLRFDYPFNVFTTNNDQEVQEENREIRKRNITYIVLDYLSRLTETYTQGKVR